MNRITKTQHRRISDFNHYVSLLSDALQNVQGGNMAYYKTILTTLRVLICPGRGNNLLREIESITGVPIECEVCFLGQCEMQSLDDYISGTGPYIMKRQYTRAEYIWELSSQDGAHSDRDMDEQLVHGETLALGGRTANMQQIIVYAKTVLAACEKQVVALDIDRKGSSTFMTKYTLEKIKFATDRPTFEKAVELYESGKVTQFKEEISAYSAVVLGTKPYRVSIEARQFGLGHCDCYLGQNNTLCKHLVAVSIYAVMGGRPLSKDAKEVVSGPKCSGRRGELSTSELAATKKSITAAMRYIKPYHGPSRIWFAYQDSLSEGYSRLAAIVSELPVSPQTAALVVNLLLRLDKKLCRGGVDDSDGTIGNFIEECVQILKDYEKLDPACARVFGKLKGKETCFGWEEPLL